MATHSSILTWRTHGQRSLEGFSPQGHRVGYDWRDLASMHPGRRSAPKYPHPDPQNLRIHHLPWQTGSRVSDRIEVANHLPLRWRVILDGLGGLNIITGILLHEGEQSESKKEIWPQKQGQKDAVPDSKNEGATSPGMQVASRSRKRHGNGFSPRTYRKECGPAKAWISAQWDRCQISNLHKFKILNLYHFKPLSF